MWQMILKSRQKFGDEEREVYLSLYRWQAKDNEYISCGCGESISIISIEISIIWH